MRNYEPVPIEPWYPLEGQEYEMLGNRWKVTRLIEASKELPVYDCPLQFLNIGIVYTVTLREMLMHMKAAEDADLSYPIIIGEDGEILDGRHRIMKAIYLGETTIKAVRFNKNPPPD